MFQNTDVRKLSKENREEDQPMSHSTSILDARRTNNSTMTIPVNISVVVIVAAEKHRFHCFHIVDCQESIRERHLAVYQRLASNFKFFCLSFTSAGTAVLQHYLWLGKLLTFAETLLLQGLPKTTFG